MDRGPENPRPLERSYARAAGSRGPQYGNIRPVPLLGNLKRVREERSMSVHQLSASSGVSADSICDFEELRRMASPRTTRKLAEALGVKPDDLLAERR